MQDPQPRYVTHSSSFMYMDTYMLGWASVRTEEALWLVLITSSPLFGWHLLLPAVTPPSLEGFVGARTAMESRLIAC